MRPLAGSIVACMLLIGCGRAAATTIDPADDVHCSVVAFYFQGLTEHAGAPSDQRHAVKALQEWYSAKMRQVAVERWGGLAAAERELAPLLDAVKSDPVAMRDELLACTERAIADPAFAKQGQRLGF